MKHLPLALALAALLVTFSALAGGSDLKALVDMRNDHDLGRPDSSAFKEPVLTVHAAPTTGVSYELPEGVVINDYEVSPAGDQVAVVTEDKSHRQQLAFWHYGTDGFARTVKVPAGRHITSLTWRPDAGRLFALSTDTKGARVLGLDPRAATLAATTIYTSTAPLRRLVVGPRPFTGNWHGPPAYRLFFGQQLPGGGFALRTVTEEGKVPYTVVGPKRDPHDPSWDDDPNTTLAASALPVGFHPAGDELIWEDGRGCLSRKRYDELNWKDSAAIAGHCGGIMAYTPNGAATLEWASSRTGLRIHDLADGTDQAALEDQQLTSVPSQTPDGRGVVGLTRNAGRVSLRYLPLSLPLADVTNAWMFLDSKEEQQRFVNDHGLFRSLADDQQIYQLYDSESYSSKDVARPYFVTTDLFWEVYGAAFDGLFIIIERERAMPAFRTFVDAAASSLARSAKDSGLATAFSAARTVLAGGGAGDPEALRILAAKGVAATPLGTPLDYGQLLPRGHYKTQEQQRYFRAMRYLMLLQLSKSHVATLRALEPAVAQAAEAWIGSYRPFIAASRLDLVWGSDAAKTPIASHGGPADVSMFPLSWAWDNEALSNVVFHDKWPKAEQIVTADGKPRLLPSGLDLAAILGNADARRQLGEEGLLATYPALAARIAVTAQRFSADQKQRTTGSLYEKWLAALATQWADAASAPEVSGRLWSAKRLQTGLASWATLRHSTILVNAQEAAEAGEGGFEEIVMAPPRGYVEPDPATFEAIATLFDATAAMIRLTPVLSGDPARDREVRNGIVRYLARSRDDARQFETIARKELAGQALDPDDYAAIHQVGGAVEHSFLLFMSLSDPSYALSKPDPMMKAADVATAPGAVLEVAVGRPLEWDQIVPFNGRREIVKGAIYSYYELAAHEPIDDATWLTMVDSQTHPGWVSSFLTAKPLEFLTRNRP